MPMWMNASSPSGPIRFLVGSFGETGRFIPFTHFLSLSGKMLKVKCDAKGRVYLRERLRMKYGDEFIVVERPDSLVLLRVPKDPVKDLARLGRTLQGFSLKAIRQRVRKRALKEAIGA